MKKLHILWTNADVETSRYMVLLYAKNSMLRSWWDEVTVIVWGAPARLIAENEEIAAELRVAQDAGVKFTACLRCAMELGVVDRLNELGVEQIFWGEPLTALLQSGEPLITV